MFGRETMFGREAMFGREDMFGREASSGASRNEEQEGMNVECCAQLDTNMTNARTES